MSAAAFPWCAEVETVDLDVLGTELAQLADRLRPSTPGLVDLFCSRESQDGGTGMYWWLHVAVVMDGPGEVGWRLAQAIDTTCIGRCNRPASQHRLAPKAKELADYHWPRAGVVVPEKKVEKKAAPVAAVQAEPVQRGLFG
jgi:hypothetical protein